MPDPDPVAPTDLSPVVGTASCLSPAVFMAPPSWARRARTDVEVAAAGAPPRVLISHSHLTNVDTFIHVEVDEHEVPGGDGSDEKSKFHTW